jgi:hypothetical protein
MGETDDLRDQLFGILEDLLSENLVLISAMRIAKDYLPLEARQEIDRFVQGALSDPERLEAAERAVVQYKSQPLAQTLAELRQQNWKKGN